MDAFAPGMVEKGVPVVACLRAGCGDASVESAGDLPVGKAGDLPAVAVGRRRSTFVASVASVASVALVASIASVADPGPPKL
ncbi:hypothetical protein ACFZBU_23880 [Embleya sp. NPDC008237]|uniref:hypothetical protein n=1 Tax=Embleya sp. NPDC008237 TaxID=3363978 RepID=UPI0036EFF656